VTATVQDLAEFRNTFFFKNRTIVYILIKVSFITKFL
jgi:hypothetical protein